MHTTNNYNCIHTLVLINLPSTAGVDYIQDRNSTRLDQQYPDSSLTFAVMLQIVDDDILEGTERLTLTLQLVTSINIRNDSSLTATIIIVDNEGKCNL